MEYGTISGVDGRVSRLVLGTMIISDKEQARSFDLLDTALEQGYNALDTAHVYGGGGSERGIGQWMIQRGNREEVVIISKGCHPNADRKRVTPSDLDADMMDSLARLQTGYVDVYLLHRDDPEQPVGPMVEAFNRHLDAGQIHAFGGSNWTHRRIEEANEYAEAHGLVGFAASSPNYGLAEQVQDPWGPGCVSISGPDQAEARLWYMANQMPILAYSSLGRGLFSGRIDPTDRAAAEEQLDAAAVRAYLYPQNLERLRRAQRLAEERGCTVPQIALAYILSSELNVFPLVGAQNEAELADNASALEIELTLQEREWLDLRSDNR